MFVSAKGKQQKQVRRLLCQEQCIDHIPMLPLGIVVCTLFLTTFLEIAVVGRSYTLECYASWETEKLC